MRFLIVFAILAGVVTQKAEAKLFRNSYVSFELPNQWDCKLTDTEWVCRYENPSRLESKEAVIILTAKEVGPTDNLSAYESYLKTPKQVASALGTPMRSGVFNVLQRQINGQPWVDGLHGNSEVRDYYTRYLATVKDRIAVLVTYSAHKSAYAKYSADFFRSVQSLRVLNTKNLLNQQTMASSSGSGGAGGTYGIGGTSLLPADMGEEMPEEGSGGHGGATSMILGLAVLLAAGGVYILLKRKQTTVK
jgi:hypothetical protein